ncbi:hypothetical protein AAC387_Pa03g3428 [Persea americana]
MLGLRTSFLRKSGFMLVFRCFFPPKSGKCCFDESLKPASRNCGLALHLKKRSSVMNKMFDSWSKRSGVDGQSRNEAKDLLEGASDLKESLIMLGKLQEASKSMARSEKKQNLNTVGKDEEADCEAMGFNRFRCSICENRLQTPQLSVDGSSRNCMKELKKAIRDGLYRQNLLSVPSDEDRAFLGQCQLGCLSDGPPASSSRFSMVRPNGCSQKFACDQSTRTDSSVSATLQQNLKSPNLIAKLMGLEEIPLESVQTSEKQKAKKTSQHRNFPFFAIDIARVRKPQFIASKSKQRTLEDIIATMRFKGLLKSNHVRNWPHISESSELKVHGRNFHMERFDNGMPPIVIIKPLNVLRCRKETQTESLNQEDGFSDPLQILKRMGGKESENMKTIVRSKDGVSCPKQIIKRLGANELKRARTKVPERELSEPIQGVKRLGAKDMKNRETRGLHLEGVLDSKQMIKRASAKELNIMETTAQKGIPDPKQMHKRMRAEEQETTETKVWKQPVPVGKQLLKKAGVNGLKIKESSIHKGASDVKQVLKISGGKELMIMKTADCYFSRVKLPSPLNRKHQKSAAIKTGNKEGSVQKVLPETETKSRRPGNRMIPVKNPNFLQKNATQNHNLGHKRHVSHESMKWIKEGHIKNAKAAKEGTKSSSTIENAQRAKDDKEIHLMHENKCTSTIASTLPDEQLSTQTRQDPDVQIKGSGIEAGIGNAKLILDYANELMTRKGLQMGSKGHPLLQAHVWGFRTSISFDQLVEELNDGLEYLKCYGKVGDDILPKDGLYMMLSKDLKGKGVSVSGLWDFGWTNGFSMQETDQIVGEIAKHVLDALMAEVTIDFHPTDFMV